MRKVQLSMVVACYNSFTLMKRLLDNLSEKARNDVELIVIDDCSTDDSYSKLVEYSRKTALSMIVLKNESNLGPGISRNRGIDIAAGQYITFFDSDDDLSDKYFETVMPLLDGNIDCILHDFVYCNSDGKGKPCPSLIIDFPEGKIKPSDAVVFARGATWGKVYKKEIITRYELRFLNQRRYEDMPFTKCVLSYCESIIYVKKPLYRYVINTSSLMHNTELLAFVNTQNAYNYISSNINPEMSEELLAIFANEYLISASRIAIKEKNKTEWKLFISEQEQICPNYSECRFLKQNALSKKIELKLIQWKRYYLLKILNFARERNSL